MSGTAQTPKLRGRFPYSGQCRICGCTATTACVLYTIAVDRNGGASFHATNCAWVDEAKRLCTNPDCVKRAVRELTRKAR